MTVDDRVKAQLSEIIELRQALRDASATSPFKNGGGGGSSGGMDLWQQSVETRLGELRGDVRQLLQLTIGAAVLVLSALAAGFIFLTAQINSEGDRLSAKIDTLTAQSAAVEGRLGRVEGRLDAKATEAVAER